MRRRTAINSGRFLSTIACFYGLRFLRLITNHELSFADPGLSGENNSSRMWGPHYFRVSCTYDMKLVLAHQHLSIPMYRYKIPIFLFHHSERSATTAAGVKWTQCSMQVFVPPPLFFLRNKQNDMIAVDVKSINSVTEILVFALFCFGSLDSGLTSQPLEHPQTGRFGRLFSVSRRWESWPACATTVVQ